MNRMIESLDTVGVHYCIETSMYDFLLIVFHTRIDTNIIVRMSFDISVRTSEYDQSTFKVFG